MPYTLAPQFPLHQLQLLRDALGQFLAQVIITADAIRMRAIEAKARFRMLEIRLVLHSAVLSSPSRIQVNKVYAQRFQLRILLSQAR